MGPFCSEELYNGVVEGALWKQRFIWEDIQLEYLYLLACALAVSHSPGRTVGTVFSFSRVLILPVKHGVRSA